VAQPSSHSHSSSSREPFTTAGDNDGDNKSSHNNMNMSELKDAVQLPAVDASLQTEQELDNIITTNMTPAISSSSSTAWSSRYGHYSIDRKPHSSWCYDQQGWKATPACMATPAW
jgi:hypothetical protein